MNVFHYQYMRYSDNGKFSGIFIQKCSHACWKMKCGAIKGVKLAVVLFEININDHISYETVIVTQGNVANIYSIKKCY